MSKFVVKPNQSSLPKAPDTPEPIAHDISIQRLLDDCLLVLDREVRNLKIMSARGKLEASDARDLRDHTKLLFEMKEQEQESLRGLTDDQLKEAAKEALK
jgi:hypothetical protein